MLRTEMQETKHWENRQTSGTLVELLSFYNSSGKNKFAYINMRYLVTPFPYLYFK